MPMLIFDNDRILTLTHCRFDAKARYGITRVIVVDFDEFLYCRPAEFNAKSQSQYFQIERQGYHQVALQQRILGSKDIINELTKISSLSNSGNALSPSILAGKLVNISMVDCILKQQHGNRSSSIFDCLTPYRISYEQVNYKSISINNPCLLTNFHHVCPLSHKDVRSMDCLCSTTFTSDHCVFIHFGFRDRFYQAINEFAKGLLSSTESKGINQLSTISTTTANG